MASTSKGRGEGEGACGDAVFDRPAPDTLIVSRARAHKTFHRPGAAAVVERRGGMLIHGAIIAREYGLPCVTGVPRLTTEVATGTPLTVDGYLGIVTVGQTGDAVDRAV